MPDLLRDALELLPAILCGYGAGRLTSRRRRLPEHPSTLGRDARTGDVVRPVGLPPGDTSTPARARLNRILNRIAPACVDCGAEVGEPCRRVRACVDRRVKGSA